ncbi:uncharacterized protein BDR25DRAFT_251318 [Lindgomyces ingoldianus]|uniref:Uncharacterized protein n=1 Tax=Lindgomyces ingoldianus TaxID=673940 RepID=A0ACB6RCB0_9PLEO|nr:uncharacterized protein BDR25DRAFT_251318 [Lindgomyces ingoldianus]KAF2476889.1 hypothetical protein BDR25DRAFT_251318 [Lindgomyces ingoldianus]
MGSRISKAVRRPPAHGTAYEAAATSPRGNHHEGPCQALSFPEITTAEPLVVTSPFAASLFEQPTAATSEDDIDAMDAQSDTSQVSYQADIDIAARLLETLRRNAPPSEPSGPGVESHQPPATDVPSDAPQHGDNVALNPPLPPPPEVIPPVFLPPPPPPPPPAEVKIVCIICCDQFSKNQEHSAVLRPCKSCGSAYCTACVKDMFIKACKDISRMPPKCCNMIQLHVALPFLTNAEAATFREKYEEWSTPGPVYCPVPTCSAFISPRLFNQPNSSRKGKQRVDSVIGTPKSANIPCPKCQTEVCTHCRELAHESPGCKKLGFGMVDDETVALLMSWGYKRCPKCGNGVRRMWGCNHIQCRCGGQWCWICQKVWDECGGNCYEDEDEDFDEDEDEEVSIQQSPDNVAAPPVPGSTEELAEPATAAESTTQPPVISIPTPAQPIRRPRNLDNRPAHYWQENFHFGDEPNEEPPDRTWQCHHKFDTAKVSFEESIRSAPTATRMECSKCWTHVHPEMKVPLTNKPVQARIVAGMSRERSTTRRGGMQHGRGRLVRGDANLGMSVTASASVSNTSLPLPLSQSFPGATTTHFPEPMEGVQFTSTPTSSTPIIDIYGRPIFASNTSTSISNSNSVNQHPNRRYSFSTPPQFDGPLDLAPQTPFSFAYECQYCGILVCEPCKEETLAAKKEEGEEEEEEEEEEGEDVEDEEEAEWIRECEGESAGQSEDEGQGEGQREGEVAVAVEDA